MLIAKLQNLLTSRVIQNVGWLGGAEFVNRIFRLATTFILPRYFETKEYALMAILYMFFDFSMVFVRGSIHAKIIQSDENELKNICDTSYWINWLICISAFLIQCGLAYPISKYYESEQLFLPLCLCAVTYLLFPLFMVKASLIERENRIKEVSIIALAQSMSANLMIVFFVVMGFGIWSIAIAMVASTFIWISVNFRETTWKVPKKIILKEWRQVFNFSKNILGVELLNKLRGNLDYLIVGKFIGLDALGLYYFAFNAGSGITMNVVSVFVVALFPHLCDIRSDAHKFKYEYFKNLKIIIAVVSAIVILQSSLSYFYVPILFGTKWIPAIPILVLICLSVIPTTLKQIGSILLNADDKPHLTLYFDVAYTVIFAISLIIASRFGIYQVALAVLLCHALMGSLFSIWSSRTVFGSVKTA